jgi:hypothetical protein
MLLSKRLGTAGLLLGLLTSAGCTKEYLDITPTNAVTAENFYKTQTDALQATTAAYSQLYQNGMFNYSLWGIGEVMSDNTYLGGGGAADGIEFQQLDGYNIPTTNPLVTSHWQRAYLGIGQANQVLLRVPGIDMDAALKNRCLGEAEFLRALYYFYLVRGFGDVPLVLAPATSAAEAASQTRRPAAEVYTQIIKDLTDAITKLPASYAANDDLGRATKLAARGLLAKVYLTQGDLANAATQARTTISEATAAGKSLWPNFADNYKVENENGQESLFEVQFKNGLTNYSTDGPGSVMNEFWGARFYGSPYVVASGGYGFNVPEKDLVSRYAAGDTRRAASLFAPGDLYPDGQVQPATLVGNPNGYSIRKQYVGRTNVNNWDSPLNFPVLRLAEVYLILAESVGSTSEGLEAINKVRRRAFGLPSNTPAAAVDYTAATASFKTAVIQERRLELAFEDDRWYDLKRTGTLVATMRAQGKTIQDFNNLLPIPQAEINVNPNLKQNDGY